VSPPLCTNKVVHQSHCRNGFALDCKVVLIVRERSSSCNGFVYSNKFMRNDGIM